MNTFFKHENHAWPPSLASNGIMHQTKKSDRMECLQSLAPQPDNILDVNVGIIMLCIYLTKEIESNSQYFPRLLTNCFYHT